MPLRHLLPSAFSPGFERDWRVLDKLINSDPNLPSVAYQAHENIPICFPWLHELTVLGAGFDSLAFSKTGVNENALRTSAFACAPGKAKYLLQPTQNSNLFRRSVSSHAASCYEHIDFRASFSAGGLVNVSGRGKFNETIYNNRNSSKDSLQTSLRVGQITHNTSLNLTPHAMTLLRTSPTGFHQTYGDYFFSALTIGADTATFLAASSSTDLQSEMRDIQVKAEAFLISATLHEEDISFHHADQTCDVMFTGFDTLSGYHQTAYPSDRATYEEVKAMAAGNVARGIVLDRRVKAALQGLGIDVGAETTLSEEEYKAVCESGLIVEVMLLPYSGLRDYVTATSNRSVASSLDAGIWEM